MSKILLRTDGQKLNLQQGEISVESELRKK